MTGFASLLAAAALVQSEPAAPARPPDPAPGSAAPPAAASLPPPPAAAAPAPAAAPPPASAEPAAPGARPPVAAPAETPAPAPRIRIDPAQERDEAERTAREFLDALAAADATRLAAAAADRFSFDGTTVAGRDATRAAWRALLAGRPGPAPRVGAVELLSAADALARLGKPPARVAPLARPGVLVAIADVGGRTVVLFVAREAGRMAVLGMHD